MAYNPKSKRTNPKGTPQQIKNLNGLTANKNIDDIRALSKISNSHDNSIDNLNSDVTIINGEISSLQKTKQDNINLTTIGTSGPATLFGSKLNIPDYSGGLGGFVPYVGATSNVDLGEYEIKAGQFEFDQTPSGAPGVAIMQWNNQDGTVDLGLKGGNVTLQIGQEQVTRVVNKTGVNLLEANYQTVRITGAQGNRLKVGLAQANNDANSAETLGIVTETINDNQEGFITTSGLVRNINTTGSLQGETWADGDMLYLSGTIAGQLTNIKPTAPIHTIIMGYVVRAHVTQGQIYVKVDNGYELDELHNVAISSPLNNQGLFYETATQLWKNKSIDTALGYTPVPTTRTLTINGTTYDLSANRSWSVGTVTSVDMSVPTGFTISGNPITGAGTLALGFNSDYSLPTIASQLDWDTAYDNMIVSASVTGTTTKTLTLNQQDGGTITASWTDYDTAPVTSVFGRTGAIVAQAGDYSTTLVTEGTNLYFTDARARAAISLTTLGNSGAATYNNTTGVLNIPQYQSVITNPVTGTGISNYVARWISSSEISTGVLYDNGNRVGIGTTTPSFKLEVIGTGFFNDYVFIANGSSLRFANNNIFIQPELSSGSWRDLAFYTSASEKMRISADGNVGIGTTSFNLVASGRTNFSISGSSSAIQEFQTGGSNTAYIYAAPGVFEIYGYDNIISSTNGGERMRITNTGNIGIGTSSPTQLLHVNGNVRVTGAYYDSNNQAGTSGQILSSTGSGTDWVDSPTATATSVAQLLPSATVTYNWVGQVIDGTWVDIFSRANNVLTTGVWTVTMYVSDFGQGGNHYQYRYSGTMTWYQGGTNQTGLPAASEIALHRMGHAANNCILYLRTTEEAVSDGGNGKLQINANYSNTSNTTITFTFVKII